MLRTHRYGDEGDLGGKDNFKDHVDETAPKRKGEQLNYGRRGMDQSLFRCNTELINLNLFN